MNRTLPFYVPHHLRDGVLRRDRHQNVNMVGQQVPFLNLALPLSREPSEDLSQMLPQRPVEHLLAVLRDKDDVIFTLPFGVL